MYIVEKYFMDKNDPRLTAQILVNGLNQQRQDYELDKEAKKAAIKMSEQNWAQRHYVWWTVISAIIGGFITKIIDVIFTNK